MVTPRVALDYEEHEDNGEIQLVDPRGVGPTIWFQHMDPPRTDRNRIHLDVYVPTIDAQGRVDAVSVSMRSAGVIGGRPPAHR